MVSKVCMATSCGQSFVPVGKLQTNTLSRNLQTSHLMCCAPPWSRCLSGSPIDDLCRGLSPRFQKTIAILIGYPALTDESLRVDPSTRPRLRAAGSGWQKGRAGGGAHVLFEIAPKPFAGEPR